ncbi:GntR family transcriptional regulator [Cupriavidus consociatus]|uniref:GntR family transcriptional regulator n=1 Tax=Cupriavidus consociatus TaxID=2821357 RepID=UPI001AE769BD|nr:MULTISPECIES: GntR family transcriptional regulator [unclassified Cupriavidus]MBP0619369.1 GntR family transcriptional regulator [Cupriavidus sp. LEh25]MDK2656017.1 GntR family transcriptional regulator [Cupriavidus sp. LEh21]
MMERILARLGSVIAAGVAACLFGVGGAWASDIACKSPAGESTVRCYNPDGSGVRCTIATDEPRPRQRHALICDSSRLSDRYERVYAEQQRMLRKGRIDEADIAAWRARRDACESARCLESLFAKFWRERDSMKSASERLVPTPPRAKVPMVSATPATPAAPATAVIPPVLPIPPTPVPAAAPVPLPALAADLAETAAQPAPDASPAAALAAPQAVLVAQVMAQPAPAAAPTPAAPEMESLPFIESFNTTPAVSYPAALTAESVFSGLAVLGMGAGFLWTRRSAEARQRRSRRVSAMIAILFFGLLLVNALLLPFTLAL